MKRVIVAALLALGVLAGGAVSAHADPTGNTIATTVHCVPGGDLDVLIKVRGNAASTFDVAAPNGRGDVIMDVTGSVYVGDNAPPNPPDYQIQQGLRHPYGLCDPGPDVHRPVLDHRPEDRPDRHQHLPGPRRHQVSQPVH